MASLQWDDITAAGNFRDGLGLAKRRPQWYWHIDSKDWWPYPPERWRLEQLPFPTNQFGSVELGFSNLKSSPSYENVAAGGRRMKELYPGAYLLWEPRTGSFYKAKMVAPSPPMNNASEQLNRDLQGCDEAFAKGVYDLSQRDECKERAWAQYQRASR